jgi:hypothetical protein
MTACGHARVGGQTLPRKFSTTVADSRSLAKALAALGVGDVLLVQLGSTDLGRARQATTCMSTNEIIDNLEGQVCARQGSVRKIHARLNKRRKRKTASGPGVQSRSEVGWIVSEASRVVCPRVADALVGRQHSEGLERLGKIIRFQEGGEVFYELPVGVVVISPRLTEKALRSRKQAGDFGPVVIPSCLRFDEGTQHGLDQNHPQTISTRWAALCKRHDV